MGFSLFRRPGHSEPSLCRGNLARAARRIRSARDGRNFRHGPDPQVERALPPAHDRAMSARNLAGFRAPADSLGLRPRLSTRRSLLCPRRHGPPSRHGAPASAPGLELVRLARTVQLHPVAGADAPLARDRGTGWWTAPPARGHRAECGRRRRVLGAHGNLLGPPLRDRHTYPAPSRWIDAVLWPARSRRAPLG